MIKILNGYNWLENEVGDETKEIKECLEKGLIKYYYGNEDIEPYFIVLDTSIDRVKEILGDDYNKLEEYNICDWVKDYVLANETKLIVRNEYVNEIEVSSNIILETISDETEEYFGETEEAKTYSSKEPYKVINGVLDELAREQAKMQIEALLNAVDNQQLK